MPPLPWPPPTLSAFADEAGPSTDEQIAALRATGLHYIDIRNIDGHNVSALPLDHARTIRSKLDAAGIKVGMYGSPIGKIDITEDFEIDIDRILHLGKLHSILGGDHVRIFSYFNKNNRTKAEFRDIAFDRLGKLTKFAAEVGLTLYHENEVHIFGEKSDDVLDIATTFRPAGLRMIFDFGNYNAIGEDVWQAWLKLRATTDALHIKDNLRDASGNLIHVPAGSGQGKIPEILADCANRKWHGPIVLEPHLQHSAAVMATGPSGMANQAYSSMTGRESFAIAAKAAKAIVASVGCAGC
jgi:sugar phosphate isomerase/epimerase